MFLKATYVVTFKILDRELYNQFDAQEGTLVRFLSNILETIRYAEDWNKRVMETYSDEYWWDDENNEGIIDVEITFNTEGLPESSHNLMMESLSMAFGDDFPQFNDLKAQDLANLACTKAGDDKGPLAAIVWWNTLIPKDENDDGELFREDSYPGNDEFKDRIINYPDSSIRLISFTYDNNDTEIELEGSYESPDTTPENLLSQITEYYPNFK
jgi:hypothetical protein